MSTVSDRFCSAEAAAQLIDDGSTVAVTGFRFAGSPEEILKALGQRHAQRQQPQNITIVFSSAQGDSDSRGLDHLARPGLLKRAIGGFFGVTPKLTRLIMDEQLEAYNLPQGQITRLYHAIAAGQPGHVSDIGTGTFV
ncbi:MAG: acyl CoA:acetate/3-ketoacid CoA transferase, partial [Elusimicrobia bacterium]|nr:acyl CoA:acetate/3-ketoacid CoA transferase [Elusimicrobiota bacterium]